MNALVCADGINIYQYNAIALKCLHWFPCVTPTNTCLHTHARAHVCRHRAAPASDWPINHVEGEESRGQWSVSYSNNQSYISQIAYPTEQAASQTGRQRGGNHCLTPGAEGIKVCVGSTPIICVQTTGEICRSDLWSSVYAHICFVKSFDPIRESLGLSMKTKALSMPSAAPGPLCLFIAPVLSSIDHKHLWRIVTCQESDQ